MILKKENISIFVLNIVREIDNNIIEPRAWKKTKGAVLWTL